MEEIEEIKDARVEDDGEQQQQQRRRQIQGQMEEIEEIKDRQNSGKEKGGGDDRVEDDEVLIGKLEALTIAPTIAVHPPKRLIVLDLNGLLIYRVFSRDKAKFASYLDKSVKVNDFYVWKRPHVDSFLDFLLERFSVGIWSSAMHHNVTALIEWTLGNERRSRLAFEWDQSRCPQEKHPTHKHKPLFLKPLSLIWKEFSQWNESNTLLVDDSPLKAKRNPEHLLFSPPEWTIEIECGKGELGDNGSIKEYLSELCKWEGPVSSFVKSKTTTTTTTTE